MLSMRATLSDGSPWIFDPRKLTLTLGRHYTVNLKKCLTSAEMLEDIMYVASKAWANDVVLACLVRDLLLLRLRSGHVRGIAEGERSLERSEPEAPTPGGLARRAAHHA